MTRSSSGREKDRLEARSCRASPRVDCRATGTPSRLRAAYGATDRLPGVPFVPPAAGSLYRPVAFGPRPDRVHELEGGADAELLRGRVNLSATVYSRHSWSPLFFGGTPGFPLIEDTVEVAN